jgi:hypothetical protein
LPDELTRLRRLVARGLTTTEALWPPIRTTYGWVHRAAELLANEAAAPGRAVQHQRDDLLREMRKEQATVGPLSPAVAHFLKVSASYGPGLFHCYDIESVPRTNNDLEQYFGSARYHQRRASGRIHAAAATVVRGAVRVLAATATRLQPCGEYQLRHPDLVGHAAIAWGWSRRAAEPPNRRWRARTRRSRRLPSQMNGVGCAFQPATASSSQLITSSAR